MSNTYHSIDSIIELVDRKHTRGDLNQALADLNAMYDDGNIAEYQYKNTKALVEGALRSL